MAKVLRKLACGFGNQCPAIERPDEGGGFYVTGTDVPDDRLPAHERKVHVPDTLLPELAHLEIPDFDAYLQSVRQVPGDMYRVQTLRQYGVPSDQDFFIRYMNGGPGPTDAELAEWGAFLDGETTGGRTYRNLHVVRGPIGDYLRYQFEWAYSYNVRHGMDVRVLDVAEVPAAASLLEIGDYWVLEHQHVVLCRYDDDGRPIGTVAVEASATQGYIAAAEMAWELGTEFSSWWAAHPQYHRGTARAA